eukprot:TRINITY_DN13641_c0_g1_i1.p1 TRINITY_DN13641_c0_g1~~TRINITY_DN13641_c0_g1_i1.p1  ORF type:complete len:475 (+),score=71.31 TRINITY_DN13641_c0_g1_i1:90-1427(+)
MGIIPNSVKQRKFHEQKKEQSQSNRWKIIHSKTEKKLVISQEEKKPVSQFSPPLSQFQLRPPYMKSRAKIEQLKQAVVQHPNLEHGKCTPIQELLSEKQPEKNVQYPKNLIQNNLKRHSCLCDQKKKANLSFHPPAIPETECTMYPVESIPIPKIIHDKKPFGKNKCLLESKNVINEFSHIRRQSPRKSKFKMLKAGQISNDLKDFLNKPTKEETKILINKEQIEALKRLRGLCRSAYSINFAHLRFKGNCLSKLQYMTKALLSRYKSFPIIKESTLKLIEFLERKEKTITEIGNLNKKIEELKYSSDCLDCIFNLGVVEGEQSPALTRLNRHSIPNRSAISSKNLIKSSKLSEIRYQKALLNNFAQNHSPDLLKNRLPGLFKIEKGMSQGDLDWSLGELNSGELLSSEVSSISLNKSVCEEESIKKSKPIRKHSLPLETPCTLR